MMAAASDKGASALPVEGQGPSLDGAVQWLNSPPLTTRGAARQGRADRLLDLLLHQLPARAALRAGVGGEVPGPGPRRDRRARARVRVRERHRQRAPGGEGPGGRLSGRGRQRLRDLARVQATSTGRRTTSSMRRAASAITTSARASTTSRSRSSSNCWPRPGSRRRRATWSRSMRKARRPPPTAPTSSRPRPTSATSAPRTSRRPVAWCRASRMRTPCRRQLATNQWALRRRLDRGRAERGAGQGAGAHRLPLPRARPAPGAGRGGRRAARCAIKVTHRRQAAR